MICYFHGADLDGRCSGAIWQKRYPSTVLIPSNYHYDFDFSRIRKDEEVAFLDFFLDNAADVDKLYSITQNVTIIDHHDRSCIRDKKFKGIIDPESPHGACQMVWEYLYPEERLPRMVADIASFDVWNRTFSNVRINVALYGQNTSLKNRGLWKRVLSDNQSFYNKTLSDGDVIIRYKREWSTRYIKAYGILCTVDGHSAVFVNLGMSSSDIFDGIDTSPYDILVRGTFSPSFKWKISLTSDKEGIDVSKIAQRFDGGGRANTAGCVVDKLEDLIEWIDDPNRWQKLRYSRDLINAIDSK